MSTNTEITDIEEELIEKVMAAIAERNGKKSWWQNNGTALLTLVIGIAINATMIGVAWGKLSTDSEHNRAEILRVDARVAALEVVVRAHHDDFDRHINSAQWQMVIDKLNSIENKVDVHIRDSTRIRYPQEYQ